MNFKTIIFIACLCIATVYGYTLGNTHESLEEVEPTREKRQVCRNCVVGPPSRGYNNRGYNNGGYYSGYRPNYSRGGFGGSNYNGYSGYNGYNGYNGYSAGAAGGGGNGCTCVGNTCYNCAVGK